MTENGHDDAMVTLTVDGRSVTVAKGTTLLEAAAVAGTTIPHYCYHPGLTSPAMCRLCLVEVEGGRKPLPSCVTEATEGQVVHTDSERALELRRGVLEFYLVNHPLDCPICDQSGECKLQDYVNDEGRAHGRGREPKRVFGRDDFGGDVLFYGDRCVMCTRCVRFMNEVAVDPRLTVVERGSRSIIDTFFEEGLDGSPYAGNIVDICPVGALVSKDFLFKARAWDLDHIPSICPNCSQGCSIELHTRDNLVQRLKPRENAEVNGHWMCDYGRSRYEWMNRGDRIEAPLVKDDRRHHAAGWAEALQSLVDRFAAASDVTVVGSASASTEDLSALAELAERLGATTRVYRSRRAPDEIPLPGFEALARRRDLAPNVAAAELFGFRRVGDDDACGGLEDVGAHEGVLIVLGDELADLGSDFGARSSLFIYLGAHPSPAQANAHFVLPTTTFAEQEGTFINVQSRVQRFWPGRHAAGAARPPWFVLGALNAHLSEPSDDVAPRAAADAFQRAAARTPALAGLDYASMGTRGALLSEPVGLIGGEG